MFKQTRELRFITEWGKKDVHNKLVHELMFTFCLTFLFLSHKTANKTKFVYVNQEIRFDDMKKLSVIQRSWDYKAVLLSTMEYKYRRSYCDHYYLRAGTQRGYGDEKNDKTTVRELCL